MPETEKIFGKPSMKSNPSALRLSRFVSRASGPLIDVSRMVAGAALLREETRGAHFRTDFPDQDHENGLYNLFLQRGEDGRPVFEKKPVALKYMKPKDIK